MSYYQKYMKYKRKYMELCNGNGSGKDNSLQSGGFDCINERVYKNILGTCWMVAVQTIFSFGDTSSNYMDITMTDSLITDLVDRVKQINGIEKILPGIFDRPKLKYLENILNKFQARYKSKVYDIRNIDDPYYSFIYSEQLENKDRCELVIAQNFKKLMKDIDPVYALSDNFGGNIVSNYLFSNIFSIFLLGRKTSFTNYYNCEFTNIKYNNTEDFGIIISIEDHACCFFVCNGVEKYYNDNDGKIFDCKWKQMLKMTNKGNCLYVQEKGCVTLLTSEEYSNYKDKYKLYKISSLTVLSRNWRPNLFDIDMQNLINGNYNKLKDNQLYLWVGKLYNKIHDTPSAIKYYEIASHNGNINALVELGNIYFYNKDMKDIDKAIKYYKMASDKGNRIAHTELGNIYSFETDKIDIYKSIKYYTMGSDQDDSNAHVQLGDIYRNVPDVRNIDKSIEYYKMAVRKGCSVAQRELGHIYKDEISVKDINKAIKFYKMASIQGDSIAQRELEKRDSNKYIHKVY